jgi:cupin 2 domain-containing protein
LADEISGEAQTEQEKWAGFELFSIKNEPLFAFPLAANFPPVHLSWRASAIFPLVNPPSLVMENLFADLPPATLAEEQFRALLTVPGLRIERIVSSGQATPPGEWYDQPHGEWVLLLRGRAALRFEDEARARELRAGDCLDIAPRRRHRVEWTAAGELTVWLAIHHGVPSAA